jgi:hypothetical protein
MGAGGMLLLAVASLPPGEPPDTDFVRRQGEEAARQYFLTIDPSTTNVACAAPAEDISGAQFLCYGMKADGTVETAWATINDDGGIDITPGGGVAPTTTVAATTTVAPYEGTGNQLVQVSPITTPTIVRITHDGAGDFVVQPQQGGVSAGDAIVDVTGSWSGRHLVGVGGTVTAFAVTADGSWTVTVEPRSSALTFDAAAGVSGESPDVVAYEDSAEWPAMVAYDGTGPIVIRAVTVSGAVELVSETGPFSGQITVPAGPGFITVDAVGSWSLAPPGSAATSAP